MADNIEVKPIITSDEGRVYSDSVSTSNSNYGVLDGVLATSTSEDDITTLTLKNSYNINDINMKLFNVMEFKYDLLTLNYNKNEFSITRDVNMDKTVFHVTALYDHLYAGTEFKIAEIVYPVTERIILSTESPFYITHLDGIHVAVLTARIDMYRGSEWDVTISYSDENVKDLNTEREERIASDTNILEKLSTETSNRESEDSKITEDLNQEIKDRESEISRVETDLESEASTRSTEDSKISASVAQEVQDRKDAITGVVNTAKGIRDDLTSETSNRKDADSILQKNIDAEASNRIAEDTNLGLAIESAYSDLQSEVMSRINDNSTLNTALNEEIKLRQSEDARIERLIDDEEFVRKSEDIKLSDRIKAEINDRESDISEVEALVTDEANLRATADTKITDNLNTEISTRISEDTRVASLVTTEATERKSADEALQKNIDAEATAREAADTKLTNSFTDVNTNLNAEIITRAKVDGELDTAIKSLDTNKVDKVLGKELSTNDFTDDLKSKLDGIAPGAQVNVIETFSIDNVKVDPSNKNINIHIPTKVSELENNNKYAVQADSLAGYGIKDAYTKTEIDSKLKGAMHYIGQLPTYDDLLKVENPSVGDIYNIAEDDHNYAWSTELKWDDLGGEVDFSNYYDTGTVDKLLNKKVDKVTGKELSTNDFTNTFKSKLEGIEVNATKTVIDATMDGNSTNPVQNAVVKSYIDTVATNLSTETTNRTNADTALGERIDSLDAAKVDKVTGKGLSANDFTDTLKSKLDNIAEGATKTIIDNSMSDTSTNPVQNKIAKSYIDAVSSNLSTETQDRQSADTTLQTNINTEVTDRKAAINNSNLAIEAVYAELESEVTSRIADNADINTALNQEIKDRKSADSSINTEITSIKSDYVKKVSGKDLSTNDFTNELKSKLDEIEAGADKTVVDTEINSTSTNPVQNKVIKAALDGKISGKVETEILKDSSNPVASSTLHTKVNEILAAMLADGDTINITCQI